jgi:hypothetical protein
MGKAPLWGRGQDMDKEDINKQLQALRERWKKEPENRKIIEIQAKLLKKSLQEEPNELFKIAEEVFSK